MSRLALGTVQFGCHYGIANQRGQVSPTEVSSILETARLNGIDTLDTAIAYGDSEKVLGEVGVKDWKIISKLPSIPNEINNVEDWVISSVEGSLERLKVNQLYGLLLHQPKQLLEVNSEYLLQGLHYIKSQKIVEKLGVSVYSPSELYDLSHFLDLDLVQIPYNIVDRRFEQEGWISRLRKSGIEIHTRSVFLQGLLLMNPSKIPPYFEQWNYLWDKWKDYLFQMNLNPVEACLSFVLSNISIDKILVGVDSLSQLRQIINFSKENFCRFFPDYLECDDITLVNPSCWQIFDS